MSFSKINYIKDKKNNYLLPFQYYNLFNLISIPTIGKIPIIKDWPNITKTIPPNDITYNIALLTGKINNIIVIDIDNNDNGITLWNELINKYGNINTPTVNSISGLHLYFKYDPEIKSSIKLKINNKKYGIDIRSDKNLITVPPSVSNINNKKYKWIISLEDTSIKTIPKWLKKFILNHQV